MQDFLAGLPIVEIGVGALVVITCLWLVRYVVKAILDGSLVTARYLEAAQRERDDWRDVALTAQETAKENSQQLSRLLVAVEGSRHVIQSLPTSRDEGTT